MRYMLDTNVCIYLINNKPKKVLSRFKKEEIGNTVLLISVAVQRRIICLNRNHRVYFVHDGGEVCFMITLDHSPVHSDPEIMGGTLVFRGTRVPAQTLLDYLQDGYDLDGFLTEFPSVARSDADEFLRLARNKDRV